MKYKLVLGCLGVFFIMSVIVACGEGAIDPFSTDDTVAQLSTASLDVGKSINACLADPVCREKYESTETPPSSAQIPLSSSSSSIPVVPGLSSSLIVLSSGGVIPPFPTSSSSLVVIVSSQSSGGISGTCAPDPAIAELGQQVTWTFTKAATLDPKDIIAATFDWTFAAGSEPTFSGKGASALNKTVSYNTSGSHTTTLSINGDTPMTCAPVQVNGAPITECECTVDNPSPDVAAGGVANWTVAGCVSTANITGYTWNGGALGEALTTSHTFAAKDETFTPTLTVSNDDNTVQTVVCPTAKAIDASLPDYVLDGTDAGTYTLGAGTYSMQYACPTANQHYQPPINISASGGWDAFNVTYSTKTTPAGSSLNSQQHNIAFASLFGSWSGALPTEMVSITVNHAVVIKCQ